MNINSAIDIPNLMIKLERLSRKIGLNVSDYQLLNTGDPTQCVEFVKHVLFYVAKEVASDMIARRCTELSPDKRIVLAFFDMLRYCLLTWPLLLNYTMLYNDVVGRRIRSRNQSLRNSFFPM